MFRIRKESTDSPVAPLSSSKATNQIVGLLHPPKAPACSGSRGVPARARISKWLAEVANYMWAQNLTSLELSPPVEYRYYDDHEWNEGQFTAIVLDGDTPVGLDEDMEIGLANKNPRTVYEVAMAVVWPKSEAA